MLTKKYFDAISDCIRRAVISEEDRKNVAMIFADWCKKENPNFDPNRFYYHCGVSNTGDEE